MFHFLKEEKVAERRWKNKWKTVLTVYLWTKAGILRMEKINRSVKNIYTFFHMPQTASISQTALRQKLIWFPTNIVFSIYGGAMRLSWSSRLDICLYRWTDGREYSGGSWLLRKMLAWLPIPLNLFFSQYFLPWRTILCNWHMQPTHL